MTNPSDKDPESKGSEPEPAKPPRPAAQGLESFRIGIRGDMKPPVSIPVVKGKPKLDQEEPASVEPEPTAPRAPRAPAAAPLTARSKTAASAPAAPAPAAPTAATASPPQAATTSPSATPSAAAAPATPALPPSEDVSPTTLAKIQKAQHALDKAQGSKRKRSPRTGSSSKTPLKRPWSKLQALASKKQQAGARASKEKPDPPPPAGPKKKRTP
jgi:translation initiation factor IF-2